MSRPEFWIIAGPNGAGKTTLAQAHPIGHLLPQVRFLNPDDIARSLLVQRGYAGFGGASPEVLREAFLEAANLTAAKLSVALDCGEAVGVETVLSSDKYRPVVQSVRREGGLVGLIYVALATPELACERVARRVRAGGHHVPEEKILSRWRRSLGNLAWFAAQASAFWVFDNSDENPDVPPKLVARGQAGRVEFADAGMCESLEAALAVIPRVRAGG